MVEHLLAKEDVESSNLFTRSTRWGTPEPVRRPNNVQAYQAYGTGREFWKRKDPANLEKAKRFFEEAIRLDPGYALAYDGLAN